MNILSRLNKPFLNLKFNLHKTNLFYNISNKSFTQTQEYDFSSPRSGKPKQSESGIWLGKNHMWAFRKSFSMKHTRITKKVHVVRKSFYSEILNKRFYLEVSTTALRTIRKYGSLDKFLLLSSEQRFDSKMAHYLKQLLLRKKKNPTMVLPYLPYSNKPRKFKAKTATEFRNFPSIYIPHEMKTKDLTSMYMDADDLMTRQERAEQVALIEQIDKETDPTIKDKLREGLSSNIEDRKIQGEILSLQDLRHRKIRDTLVRLKDRATAKYHFLKTLEKSEEQTKIILKEKYRHFSEDYPEVQLILQQTAKERVRIQQKAGAKTYSTVKYEIGEAYLNEDKEFDPVKKKAGIFYTLPQKLSTYHKMKEKKLRSSKVENKFRKGKKKSQLIGAADDELTKQIKKINERSS